MLSMELEARVAERVRAAGDIVRRGASDLGGIETKSAHNFVTAIDKEVQDVLVEELLRLVPGSAVIAEESSLNRYDFDRPTWVLDPVDGTTNLIHDFRHSAVSLALYLEGRPAHAFILNPYLNELFTARAGGGASLNGRPIRTTSSASLHDCLVGFGTTPYDRSDMGRTFDILKAVFARTREIRRTGSAALDLAYVAAGRLDAFFELTLQPWDYAAGALLVAEAGGTTTDWAGRPLTARTPSSVLATNGLVHEAMRGFLA